MIGAKRARISLALCVFFGAMLSACGRSPRPSDALPSQPPQAAEGDVWPEVLRGAKSLELGELILLLMPDSGATSVGWDFQTDSPIKWQSEPFKEVPGSGYAYRMGWVRVNVQGEKSTVLRERKLELGWTVTYSNEISASPNAERPFMPPKFGVESIEIKPGAEPVVDNELVCFGAVFSGCDFDEPIASLIKAGIHVQTICSKEISGGHVSAFILTHPGRNPTVMTWTESGGSGGTGSWVTLKVDPDNEFSRLAGNGRDTIPAPYLYKASLCQ